jgi:hypothetical protein
MSYSASRYAPLRGVFVAALLAAISLLTFAGALIAVGSAQASTLPTLTLSVTKSSITVGGTTQSGAVNVVSTATGANEATAVLFLLKPGVSVAEVESALKSGAGKDPNKSSKYGSIVFDAQLGAGHASEAQTILAPGQYVALGGTGEGPPKLKAPFTVTVAKSPATLPAPQATIRTIEFGFRGPSTLHDGELVRFENEGYLVHMNLAAPVKNLKAAKQAIKLLAAGNEKQLEKLIIGPPGGFAGPLSHEAFQQETITAKPGIYVEVCFMETQDGRSHAQLGQERIIKITK